MDQPGAHVAQAGAFARFQVDRMAVQALFTQQAKLFVCVQIIARLGEQALHPGDFVGLFAEMGLHQAIGMLCPELAQRIQLLGCGGGREARCDRIGQPVNPVPARDQRLAVVIGGLGGVTQPFGGVAVHAGLACDHPLAARLRLGEKGINRHRVDRAVAGHGGHAVARGQVQIGARGVGGVAGIVKAHLFGEGVCIEPVDQPFAPAGDDTGLGIVDMRIDKPRHDQPVAIIDDPGPGMGGAQILSRSGGSDSTGADQHRAICVVARRVLWRHVERRAVIVERLPQQQGILRHWRSGSCLAREGPA